VVLDAPEHEDDGSDDCEDQRVGEVSVERQLDDVSTQAKCPCRLNEGRKDPPTDRTEKIRVRL